jgi:Ca2+/Na+ antiporter
LVSLLNAAAYIVLLVLATVIFAEGVEKVAVRLGLTRFATGALLTAPLTALPETIIAILSPFQGGLSYLEVGAGSVLGAPSITILVGAPMVVLAHRSRAVNVGVSRNYILFAAIFLPSILALLFLREPVFRFTLAFGLMALYVQFARGIYREEGELMESRSRTVLERVLRTDSMALTLMQVSASLALMIYAADSFMEGVVASVDPLAYSLLLSPLGTCLEEVLVAAYWSLRRKADVALSLLSGENLIQTTFVLGVGIFATGMYLPLGTIAIALVYTTAALALAAILRAGARPATGLPIILLYPLYMAIALNMQPPY